MPFLVCIRVAYKWISEPPLGYFLLLFPNGTVNPGDGSLLAHGEAWLCSSQLLWKQGISFSEDCTVFQDMGVP